MKAVHRGFILIDQRIVLDFLQFPNGEILQARIDDYGHLELCIADNEMPEVKEGESVPVVMPAYTRYQDAQGHWVALREPLNKNL